MSNNENIDNDKSSQYPEKVAVVRCQGYESSMLPVAVENCVGLIGGFKKYIGGAKKILLKPNLLSASKPDLAVTTHPLFIEAVIHLIKKNTNSDVAITVADSPGVATSHTKKDLAKLYSQCGLSYLEDIENVTLSLDDNYSTVSFKDGFILKKLEVINPILEADIIINLPKFKTHSLTRITGAVKNMFGIIHGRTKTLLHTKFMDSYKFNNMLLDVYLSKIPVLNIMDGVIGLEGEGPGASGKPRNTGLILASANGLALDNIMAQIMGFNVEKIPVIMCAKERNVSGWHPEKIELCGGNINSYIIKDYILPKNSPVDKISQNRFVNTYILPFIRNNLSVSPYQNLHKCTMCNICIEICPEKAISSRGGKLIFDYKKCIRCYCCSEMCPEGAIDLNYSLIGNLIFKRKNVK